MSNKGFLSDLWSSFDFLTLNIELCRSQAPQKKRFKCANRKKRRSLIGSFVVCQPFQWRRPSRTPTWRCSSRVMAATSASWRACGRGGAPTWTACSNSSPRPSSRRARCSPTCPHDERSRPSHFTFLNGSFPSMVPSVLPLFTPTFLSSARIP